MIKQQIDLKEKIQIGYRNFEQIIKKVDNKKVYEKMFRQAKKIYDLRLFNVTNMTPVKARKIYSVLCEKYSLGHGLKQNWLQNQRKLFIWMVLCQCFIQQKHVTEMILEDFKKLSSIFNNKDEGYLKYQSYGVIKKTKNEIKWTMQEDELVMRILKGQSQQYGIEQINWNNVSKEFYKLSNERFYRLGKHIRQRWLNHLDPNKIKGKWSIDQDLILLKFVQESGKKWSQIVRKLEDSKSEHMVKNRYHSLINKKMKQFQMTNQKKILKKIIQKLQSVNINQMPLKNDHKTSTKTNDSYENEKCQKQTDTRPNIQNIFVSKEDIPNRKRLLLKKMSSFNVSQKGSFAQEFQNIFFEQKDFQEEKFAFKNHQNTPLFTPIQLIDRKEGYQFPLPISPMYSMNVPTPNSLFFADENLKEKGIFRGLQESFNFRVNSGQIGLGFSSNFQKFIGDNKFK